MLPAEIKNRFYAYIDQWSVQFTDADLIDIFRKAEYEYFTPMADQWGKDLRNNIELSTLIKTYTVNPSGNTLDTSSTSTDLPNYWRFGFVIPTYTGATPKQAVLWEVNNRKSVYSQPTIYDPGYDFVDNLVNIYPQTPTVTNLSGQYCRTPYFIDFVNNTPDVPITDQNAEAIIQKALIIAGVKIRESNLFQMEETIDAQENRT